MFHPDPQKEKICGKWSSPEDSTERATKQVEDISQEAPVKPWRSTKLRKPNPKYSNAAITKDVKEPFTLDEAFQSVEWRKRLKRKLCFQAEPDLGLNAEA